MIIIDILKSIFMDAMTTKAEEISVEKVEGTVKLENPSIDVVLSKYDRVFNRN